jgi:cytosine/adenosine deaminase-related metal-dependent hydrolase
MGNSLLIKNARYIVTMDDSNTVYENSDLYIYNGFVKDIGKGLNDKGYKTDRIIDAKGMIIYPGLVNSHHHLFEVITRNLPHLQNMELFEWLKALYHIQKFITNDMIYASTLVCQAELLKYGCTTTSDQHYIYPKGEIEVLDRIIEAAKDVHIRIHACRSGINRGESDGGVPPDDVVETKKGILSDMERLIKKYHDPDPGSMCQIAVSPISSHSITPDLMIESAELARQYGVRLHMHCAVTDDEDRHTMQTVGMRPIEYMQKMGWLGSDVWFAHGNKFTLEDIKLLAATNTGVCHCSVSNQKLSCGVANITDMLKEGVNVGLGVDGSTSNDSSSLLNEIKNSYNIHRLIRSQEAPSGADILSLATTGSAKCLGRTDIGSLAVGKVGDCFMISTHYVEFGGALQDPVGLPAVVGINRPVDYTIVGGKVVYEKGELKTIDEEKATAALNKYQKELLGSI